MAEEKPWHRRHAIQLAAQLPEEQEDALLVLEATKLVLLPGFWTQPNPSAHGALVLVLDNGERGPAQ